MYIMQFLFPVLCLVGLAWLLWMGAIRQDSSAINAGLVLFLPFILAYGGYSFFHEQALTEWQLARLVAGDTYVFDVSSLSADGAVGIDEHVLSVLSSGTACGPATSSIGDRGLSFRRRQRGHGSSGGSRNQDGLRDDP